MARNVVFKVDADTAKGIQGFLDLAKAQQANEAKFDKSIQKMGSFEKGLSKMGSQIRSTMAGFAVGAVGINSLQQGIQNYMQGLEMASQKNRQLQADITAYLALGQNIKNSKGLTRDILNLSDATGLDPRTIADLKFALQSSAGSLSKEIQQSIEANTLDLTKLTNSDADANLRLLVKGMMQYGDQVKDATELANKFNLAAEMGDMTFGILASRFPEVGGAVKAVKGSLNEGLGALVALTQVEGDADKAMTSFRNIVLSLEDAMNKGLIPASGTLTEKLQQIGKMDSEKLLAIFGKENLSAAANLAGAMTVMADAVDKISKADTENIKKLIENRFDDPSYRAADNAAKAEQIIANTDLKRPDAAASAEKNTKFKLEMEAIRQNTPPWLRAMPGQQMGAYGWAKMMDKMGLGGIDKGGEGLGDIGDMMLKEAQFAEGTSPEDIALKRAIRRNKEAREGTGGAAGGSAAEAANPEFDAGLQAAIRGGYEKRYRNRPGATPPKITERPAGAPFSQAGFDYERQLERGGYDVGRARGRGTHDAQSNRAAAFGDIHLHISQMNVSGSAQEFRDLAAQSARTPRTG